MITRCTTAALLALAGAAQAGVTPLSMDTQSLTRTCSIGCAFYTTWESDQDSAAAAFGTFASHSVATQTVGGANSYGAQASSVLTMNGNTGFTLQHLAQRSPTGENGSADIESRTTFSFLADASAGTMTIAWSAQYQRLTPGPWLGTGVSFSTPSDLALFGGRTVEAASYDSLSGIVSGSWSFDLRPDTYYTVQLGTGINESFFVAGGAPAELLDVTYVVTLPTITAAVPEPAPAALLLAGLAIGAGLWRRHAERSSV